MSLLAANKYSIFIDLNTVIFSQNFIMINNRKFSDSVAESAIAIIIFVIRINPRCKSVTSPDHNKSCAVASFRLRTQKILALEVRSCILCFWIAKKFKLIFLKSCHRRTLCHALFILLFIFVKLKDSYLWADQSVTENSCCNLGIE